jgi:hypothetical protein
VLCRRKYFSSLERLQIRQQSFDDQHDSGRSSRASSSILPRPSLDRDYHQAEIDFFTTLPEKVRKLYYSRDEQITLLAKCEQSFLPCDERFERAQQRYSDFHFGFPQDVANASQRGRSRKRLSTASSSVSPRRVSGFLSTPEKERGTDSRLHVDTMSRPTSRRYPSIDLRRTMSLTSAARHYSLTSAVADPPLFTNAPSQLHQRAHSVSVLGRRSSHMPAAPLYDPEAEAIHYQDPAARRKLRTYLSSPQKFDEAIEFGFPSTASDEHVTPHFQLPPIAGHARKFSRDMHTFLREGKLSFFEDGGGVNLGLDSDGDSVADMESPTTPSSTGLSFRLHSRHLSHSKLSSENSPGLPLNREMTLRMTLTRPDLRADEDQLYGWQSASPKSPTSLTPPKDDPLALEDLVLTDDMTGTKGAFYIQPKPRGNLVSRLLKRASLKGR